MLALKDIQAATKAMLEAHVYFAASGTQEALPVIADNGTAHTEVERMLRERGLCFVVFPPMSAALVSQVYRTVLAEVEVQIRILINPTTNRGDQGGRAVDPMEAIAATLQATVGSYTPQADEKPNYAFRASDTPFELIPNERGLWVYDVRLVKPTVL